MPAQIERLSLSGAESAHRVPAFFDHPPHQLKNAVESCLRRQTLGHLLDRDVELHGGANHPL